MLVAQLHHVSPSVGLSACISPTPTGRIFMKFYICQHPDLPEKSYRNIGDFSWRLKYVYIVDSNMESLNNTKENTLLSFGGRAFSTYIVDGDIGLCSSTMQRGLIVALTWQNVYAKAPHCNVTRTLPSLISCGLQEVSYLQLWRISEY